MCGARDVGTWVVRLWKLGRRNHLERVSRCILPPAPVANDTSVEARLERLKAGLHSHVPANQVSEHLTPEYAEWSDHGNEAMWLDLYDRIKKTETGERRTGAGHTRRRPNKRRVTG